MRHANVRSIATLVVITAFVGCGSPSDGGANSASDNALQNNYNGVPGQALAFENLRTEEIGPTRAVVRFETTLPTTCEARYGTSADALDNAATDPNMEPGELSITHEVPLEDLEPNTTYFWRGYVVDETGSETLSEVQEFTTAEADGAAPELQNFALDAVVMDVSSNFGGGDLDSTWGANNAFDGQMSTEWATNGDGDDAMLRVDLGSVRKVTHFGFRSRKMTDGSSIIEQVQVTFGDGEPIGPFDTPDPDQRYLFELEMPQAAQTVLVEAVQTTGGNTGAKEIEFLGTPKE